MPAPASRPEFSDAAIEELRRALRVYGSTWDGGRREPLRLAIERLCSEAHAAQLGPERMLLAVKAAWARVPRIEHVDAERARIAFERLVGYCIDVYYGERSSPPSSD